MNVSALESTIFAGLFGDSEVAAVLDDASRVARMVEVEAALARAQAACGVIPGEAAQAISNAATTIQIRPETLTQSTAETGVPVIALIAALRGAVDDETAHFVHWGATSQDIMDTGAVLQFAEVLYIFEARLAIVIDTLHAASQAHAAQVIAARTRSQIASPITFGLRIAQWAQPLITLEAELPALRALLLRLQFGGASGASTAIAPNGAGISAVLAQELGLADGPVWHVDRSGILTFSAWSARLTAALSKISQDLIMMGRSEIGEAQASASGGSSTLPHKANPVLSEAVVTLGGFVASLQSGMLLAATPLEERDGGRWSLEWLILPQILLAAGASLRHAIDITAAIRVNPAQMAKNLTIGNGSVMSEAATFALSAHMSRAAAQSIVKQSLATATATRRPISDILAAATDAPINWPAVMNPATAIKPAREMADRIFATRETFIANKNPNTEQGDQSDVNKCSSSFICSRESP